MKPYFQVEGVTLYHTDCLPLLNEMADGSVDAVISDPPYGDKETHAKHLSTVTLRSGEAAGRPLRFEGITIEQCVELAGIWTRIAKRWVVFTCEWKYAHAIDATGLLIRLGIWRKPDGAPQFTGDRPGMGWEAVAICHRPGKMKWNGGGKHAFWSIPKANTDSDHPTAKPVPLVQAFVKDFTDEGETVLDPFMGSGTTGVACVRAARRFVGIEIEEAYCEVAASRIEAAMNETPLFRFVEKAS